MSINTTNCKIKLPNGLSNNVPHIYHIVNGEPKEIKEVYIIKNGIAKLCWQKKSDNIFTVANTSPQNDKTGIVFKPNTNITLNTIAKYSMNPGWPGLWFWMAEYNEEDNTFGTFNEYSISFNEPDPSKTKKIDNETYYLYKYNVSSQPVLEAGKSYCIIFEYAWWNNNNKILIHKKEYCTNQNLGLGICDENRNNPRLDKTQFPYIEINETVV